jgi:signal transduction histidine kinase
MNAPSSSSSDFRLPATAVEDARSDLRSDVNGPELNALLGTLSHKMRGPLNSISAWAQLLRSGRLEGDASRNALAAIVRAVQAQTRILDDVLDLARIRSGALQLETRPLQLSTVLVEAHDSVIAAAREKGVELGPPPPSPARVIGDPARLRQVFVNMLTNAIRFTPPGGSVDVEIDADDAAVTVRVRDTGHGLEPELLSRLFPRLPAGAAEGTGIGGQGLGLALVQSLVERHGGTVHAASDGRGLGATFSVRLPASTAASVVS